MTAQPKKSNNTVGEGIEIVAGDVEPINLDPPDPKLARWQELAERDVDIYHDGDASLVINAPRPAWSDPGEDYISTAGTASVYMSAPALVPLSLDRALKTDDGDTLQPARLAVRAMMGTSADQVLHAIEIKLVRPAKDAQKSDKPWMHTPVSLTIREARELVDTLIAATDLIGDAE